MIAETSPKNSRVFDSIGEITILAAVVLFMLSPCTADAFEILLGTGKAGTFNHFVGKSICRAVNRHAADMHCKAIPTADETDSITNLQGGSLDLCLIDARTLYDAINRKGNFAYLDIRYDNLLNLQRLYDVSITMIVRNDADIDSLDALKGKRINAGTPGSPQHMIMEAILKAKGWTQKDFSLVEKLPQSQSQAQMAFCHSTIQAMLHIGVHPDPALEQLSALCDANLIGLYDKGTHDLMKRNAAFLKTHISDGTYPFQTKSVTTIGTGMMLVSSRDLDDESVYRIMDAIYRSQKQIQSAHPALSDLKKSIDYGLDLGLERHPGAKQYFSEH